VGVKDWGAILCNLAGDEAITRPRRTLLPVLIVLFLVSYGLMTMLVVEQARTIDSQRSLISLLFDDSVQLSGIKSKAIQKQNAEARARAQAEAQSRAKAPSAKVSPPQDSQVQTPASQATPSGNAKNHASGKLRRKLPLKPPRDAADESDERRMVLSI
jgi:hypothetical protein